MIVGAQVVLDPASAASQGARGIYDSLEHNTRLRDAGYVEMGVNPADPGKEMAAPAATEPPVNVDVPYAGQEGATLSCTMGNWEGEPSSYSYQWQFDGANVGIAGPDSSTYVVNSGDAGQTAICIVTATNAIGSTIAPPSNGVVITQPPAREA